MIGIGLIGFGYWGPNLARNISQVEGLRLVSVCETDSGKAALAQRIYPAAKVVADATQVFKNPDVHAVVIATPVRTHFELARQALLAGKDVLIEKPMTINARDAEEILSIAQREKRIVAVDHTFVFTSAVQKIKEYVTSGELGDLLYFDSVRINLGLFQSDINVIDDLAPHDFSILNCIRNEDPLSVQAFGHKHAGTPFEDQAYIHLLYSDHFVAHIHVSWLAPVKIRQTLIAGTKKMIVYNDMEPSEKIKVYDKSITLKSSLNDKTIHDLKVDYRTGDMVSPKLEQTEALKGLMTNFADSIRTRKAPLMSGSDGYRIVKILEATRESIEGGGKKVYL